MSTALFRCYLVLVISLFSCFMFIQPAVAGIKLVENWDTTPALDCSWENRTVDFQRYVDTTENELHLVIRPYATTIDGDFCEEKARVKFQDPAAITSIKATVNLSKIEHAPEMLMTVAEINGEFYSTTLNRVDYTGEVHIKIRFGDRGDGLEVWWGIYESLDSDFIDATETTGQIVAPGNAGLEMGNDYEVTLGYDGDKTFTYSFIGEAINETGTVVGPDRGDDPYWMSRSLEARVYMESPLTANPDTNTLEVVYSDVYINGSATLYDDFTTPLDNNLWKAPDSEARVIDNKLKMRVVSTNGNRQQIITTIPTQYGSANFVQADLMLQGGLIPDGTMGEVHLNSAWGNGKSPFAEKYGDGHLGTQDGIRKAEYDNQYSACCIATMDDEGGVPYPYVIFYHECVVVSPDKFYTVSSALSGTVFSCTVKDTSTGAVVLSKTADTKDSGVDTLYRFDEQKDLRVRVRNIPDPPPAKVEAIGYFDNVYIDGGSNILFQVLPALIGASQEQ